jgi:energy-converting hydrogenase Eha subunit F
MNRTRIVKSSLLIVVVFAALIGAGVVAQGTALNSSAAASEVIRQPRPHPKSHIKSADAAASIEPGIITLYPRPHPTSHIKINEPGSTLYPRPHPQSHIKMLITRPRG